jgi:hypothetical protein
MAASSVTGTGPGESHGLQKPENHCGCGCGGKPEEAKRPARRRLGCVRRHSSPSHAVKHISSGGHGGHTSCF